MKRRISIAVSPEILKLVDRAPGPKLSRSAFIESVLRRYFQERARSEAEFRDLQLINAAAERLNRETKDVLEFLADDN